MTQLEAMKRYIMLVKTTIDENAIRVESDSDRAVFDLSIQRLQDCYTRIADISLDIGPLEPQNDQ